MIEESTATTAPFSRCTSPARISAYGMYVPQRILANRHFTDMVDTSDEWIVKRTGIRERRIAAVDEFTSDLCYEAVLDLERAHGVSVADVDFIIAATVTPDYSFPSVSAILQHRLEIQRAGAMDISAACAGFMYGLITASGLVASGAARKVLVVAAETLSKITDYTDRNTCVLFGDGAGCALVEQSDHGGFLAVAVGSDGSYQQVLYRSGLRTRIGQTNDDTALLRQNGREIYKWAVSTIPNVIRRLLKSSGMTTSDIDWFIPHSANLRMIESICAAVGFSPERMLWSLETYGNTSAASIPLALIPAMRDGRVKPGDTVLTIAFGAGLVWAGSVFTV